LSAGSVVNDKKNNNANFIRARMEKNVWGAAWVLFVDIAGKPLRNVKPDPVLQALCQ
jgi:hypothetical protein